MSLFVRVFVVMGSMHMHMCTYKYARIHIHIHMHVFSGLCLCVYTYMYVYLFIYLLSCLHVNTHIGIHKICIRTHTCAFHSTGTRADSQPGTAAEVNTQDL